MLKKISFKEINNYKDSFSLFSDSQVALVKADDIVNPITIGWGLIGILWNKPCLCLFIHKSRFSKQLFDKANSFSLCVLKDEYRKYLEYFGRVSGRCENKVEVSSLEVSYSNDTPYFVESDLVIIAKKMTETCFNTAIINDERILNWYKKDGVHSIYFGEIIEVLRSE